MPKASVTDGLDGRQPHWSVRRRRPLPRPGVIRAAPANLASGSGRRVLSEATMGESWAEPPAD